MQSASVRFALLLCLLISFASPSVCRSQTAPINTIQSLLQNGAFTTVDKSGNDVNWSLLQNSSPVIIGSDSTGPNIKVQNTLPNLVSGLTQTVQLRPEWSRLLLRGWILVDALQAETPPPGSAVTPCATVAGEWSDGQNKSLGSAGLQQWTAQTGGWVEVNQLFTPPTGARSLTISPEIIGASGDAYFRGLSLVAFVQTFDDEFDGKALDQGRWSVSTGKHNAANEEQQLFSPDEVTVANGILNIHAEQKPQGDYGYESGDIYSTGKFQQLYGLFEFRLKLGVTNGAWSAAYLLSGDDAWPPEIDVEELAGQDPGYIFETNHYANDYGYHEQSQVNFDGSNVDRTQWHTYAVVWEPGQVAWYLDGTYKGTTGQPIYDASDVPMYIRINSAVGGFGGDPSQGTWPQDFSCDYVHVYERSDLGLPVYPEPMQEITLPNNKAALSAMSCNPVLGTVATWKQVDGPTPARIDNIHAITTQASFTKPGVYEFSLQVVHGLTKSSGSIFVCVSPPLAKPS